MTYYRGFDLRVFEPDTSALVFLDGELISGPWESMTAAQTWVEGWHRRDTTVMEYRAGRETVYRPPLRKRDRGKSRLCEDSK